MNEKQTQAVVRQELKQFYSDLAIGKWKGREKENFSMNEKQTQAVVRQELKQFYSDLAIGKWKGREKEAEAEEIRLLKALGVNVKQ